MCCLGFYGRKAFFSEEKKQKTLTPLSRAFAAGSRFCGLWSLLETFASALRCTGMSQPLLFDPAYETLLPDEAEVEAGLRAAMLDISRRTFADTGRAWRAVHAKSHGVVTGELEVLAGLAAPYAQGVFARPGRYPMVMRFSTTPGDVLDDRVSTPRGIGLKIVGVEGARLAGSEAAVTQDWVMGNSPSFQVADAAAFLRQLKLLVKTTDKSEGVKVAVSALSRTAERALEAVGGKSATLTMLAGQAETHLLGDTFYTQGALLHGAYFGKACVSPVSDGLLALHEKALDLHGRPDGIRDAVGAFFGTQAAVWEFRVQLCTDLAKMPVEDAATMWPEDESAYVTVARITAPAQASWSDGKQQGGDVGLAFNPWNGLAAHRPLGSVMRSRKLAYAASRLFRAERNGVAVAEPSGVEALPA